MKIEQSKVRVDMPKEKSAAGGFLKIADDSKTPKIKKRIAVEDSGPDFGVSDLPVLKPRKAIPAPASAPAPSSLPANPLRDDYSTLRDAAISVQRIRIAAQQELEQIKRMRADAIRYQQETATKARSTANQLVLHARMASQREIEELLRKASEEIQKMLADIRVIRITAQEELSAQRKFTDAAKLNSLSFSFKEQMEKAMNREPVEKVIVKTKRTPVTTR